MDLDQILSDFADMKLGCRTHGRRRGVVGKEHRLQQLTRSYVTGAWGALARRVRGPLSQTTVVPLSIGTWVDSTIPPNLFEPSNRVIEAEGYRLLA